MKKIDENKYIYYPARGGFQRIVDTLAEDEKICLIKYKSCNKETNKK